MAEWERRPNGRVAYRFTVHDDVLASEVEALTRPPVEGDLEGFDPGVFARFRLSVVIVIDPDRLDMLLGEEIVSYVEPVPGPSEPHDR